MDHNEYHLDATNAGSIRKGGATTYFLFFILVMPFLQFGVNYYLSVQFLLFIFLYSRVPLNVIMRNRLALGISFVLMVFPSMFYQTPDTLHLLLHAIREWLCFGTYILLLNIKSVPVVKNNLGKYVVVLLAIFCGVVFVQSLALSTGLLLMPPSELLIANQGTAESVEKAASFLLFADMRPSALYGEPSYLAFICVSLLYVVLSSVPIKKLKQWAIIFSVAIALLSRSLSAAIGLVILLGIYFVSISNIFSVKRILSTFGILIVVAGIIVYLSDWWFVQRIVGLVAGDTDNSSAVRLVMPFFLISKVFSSYWLGVPQDMVNSVFGIYFDDVVLGVDNGLLNLFINYGYSGIILLFMLLYNARHNILLMTYLLLAAMYNGAFLSIDKVAIIGFVLLLSRALQLSYSQPTRSAALAHLNPLVS